MSLSTWRLLVLAVAVSSSGGRKAVFASLFHRSRRYSNIKNDREGLVYDQILFWSNFFGKKIAEKVIFVQKPKIHLKIGPNILVKQVFLAYTPNTKFLNLGEFLRLNFCFG